MVFYSTDKLKAKIEQHRVSQGIQGEVQTHSLTCTHVSIVVWSLGIHVSVLGQA